MSLPTDNQTQIPVGNEDGENETRMEMLPTSSIPNNVVVSIPRVRRVPHVTFNIYHVSVNQATDTSSREAQPEDEAWNNGGSGKMFFPLTVQAGLSAFTSVFGTGGLSATAEAKQLVHVAVISNIVGYIGCLAAILLRHRCKLKAANIMGSVGSAAAVFAFLTMMGTLLELKPLVMIGVAAVVTVVFFAAVTEFNLREME